MPATVYIFDDDADILLLCSIVLRRRGYHVFTSSHCDDIAVKVKSVGARVVFLDNQIPPEGGRIAGQQLKEDPDTSNIPVIYFTANTEIEQLSREAGAQFFIRKPFDITEMETIIEKAIAI